MNSNTTDIDQVMQLMRTLTTAQIRKQMETDKRSSPFRLQEVIKFFKAANEQVK